MKWTPPPRRPATEQEIADANDTAWYVLAHTVSLYSGHQVKIEVTDMLTSYYVQNDEGEMVLWDRPTYVVAPYRPAGSHWEDRFAFAMTSTFRTLNGAGQVVETSPANVARKLEEIARDARIVGAQDVQIDLERRVVTGTFLYLPDHPEVLHVRAFGEYSTVDARGKHAPAEVPPYATRT